ncbi:MAG: pantoate--beta-alanine ligase [Gammaproteobacteria bacterium]|nr:pantoate--beta-alanine ligase [Gammaproteobacteria bacterium]TVQ46732.1 MAG: pantoate--beta-alanine ligase [Gammaproteobacteria bacterium]
MQTLVSVGELRTRLSAWRQGGARIALVPTMGNLHEGHLELVRLAAREAERVVVSIFVNPTQFGPSEDFASYPRTPEADRAALAAEGVDAVFLPEEAEVYPLGRSAATQIRIPALMDDLCGRGRPGHFEGVATVVLRLLNMVGPDVAVFGQKDYQQQLVIRHLVRDLNVVTRILVAPISREADGLARSSRNQYLDPGERARAPALYAALRTVAAGLAEGGQSAAALCDAAMAGLQEAGLAPEYLEVRDAATLAPADPVRRPWVVLAAARLGRARLIDNLLIP